MTLLADLPPEKLLPIQVLILDVDGVLTDGRITYTAAGDELKSFHVRDGSGIKYWHRAGRRSAIISGRDSPLIGRRAEELGVKFVETGAKDKLPALARIVAAMQVPASACAYIGDDLPDLPPMRAVGLALAVADAAPEVREAAAGVTVSAGGCGAVREVIEALLQAQGLWECILERYRGG